MWFGLCSPLAELSFWQALAARFWSSLSRKTDSWRLCLLSVGHPSFPTPLQHQAPSALPPCSLSAFMHFLSPFLNNCNLSFYCRCCPNIGNDCFVHVPANHHTKCIFVFLSIKCLQVLNDFCFHSSSHAKFFCVYSHVLLYGTNCSFLLWKAKQNHFVSRDSFVTLSTQSVFLSFNFS